MLNTYFDKQRTIYCGKNMLATLPCFSLSQPRVLPELMVDNKCLQLP